MNSTYVIILIDGEKITIEAYSCEVVEDWLIFYHKNKYIAVTFSIKILLVFMKNSEGMRRIKKMKIKVFTLNSNGKIEISEEELRKLLDDSYWEGYYDSGKSWTYNINPLTGPSITCASNKTTTTSATNDASGENNAK